jgi:hypothetical protein
VYTAVASVCVHTPPVQQYSINILNTNSLIQIATCKENPRPLIHALWFLFWLPALYPPNKAEVSKVNYSSKAKSFKVWGVSTFCDTFSNLGNLFRYNFKKASWLPAFFPSETYIPKLITFHAFMGNFEIIFTISLKFTRYRWWLILHGEHANLNKVSVGANHRYSTIQSMLYCDLDKLC